MFNASEIRRVTLEVLSEDPLFKDIERQVEVAAMVGLDSTQYSVPTDKVDSALYWMKNLGFDAWNGVRNDTHTVMHIEW